jgi:hypothetical protein
MIDEERRKRLEDLGFRLVMFVICRVDDDDDDDEEDNDGCERRVNHWRFVWDPIGIQQRRKEDEEWEQEWKRMQNEQPPPDPSCT